MIRISIIIITWNQKENLKNCLNSLLNHCANNIYEIILINNNSTDGSKEIMDSYIFNPLFKFIHNDFNKGVSAARNQGLKVATGDFILLLDDDTIITNNFIEKMQNHIEDTKNIGIIAPALYNPDGSIQPSARVFPSIRSILVRAFPLVFTSKYYKKIIYGKVGGNVITDVDWVIGACQFINAEAIKMIGYLDEGYFFGYEDIDYCQRVKKLDFRIIYNPEISIVHIYQRKSAKRIFSMMKYSSICSFCKKTLL